MSEAPLQYDKLNLLIRNIINHPLKLVKSAVVLKSLVDAGYMTGLEYLESQGVAVPG